MYDVNNYVHSTFISCTFRFTNLMRNPLYSSAPLTTEESMYATYQYAIRNKLSYQATSQLLELIRIHLPSPNCYPRSFYALKKYLSGMATLTLCSTCLEEVPKEYKHCHKRECKHSSLCYYAVLPFQDNLESIVSGMQVYSFYTTDVFSFCTNCR